MGHSARLPKGIDPKLTEHFLLDTPGVADASVWWSEGDLFAYVRAYDGALSEADLRSRCLNDLGLHQTPNQITLDCVLDRAA